MHTAFLICRAEVVSVGLLGRVTRDPRLDEAMSARAGPSEASPASLATLNVISGRPGTGKTTLAKAFSRQRGACYLRVDAAETALARTGLQVGIEGYAVIHELAVSNLLLGIDVVVDAVNASPEARAGWQEAARRASATLVLVETTLPDQAEHHRRVEARNADIPGHVMPSWDQVQRVAWTPWDPDRDGSRLLIDTTDSRLAIATLSARYPTG